MLSEELKNLIEAAISDGNIDDHKKSVLAKRAQKEGIDSDEFEIYLQSTLQKHNQQKREKKKEEAVHAAGSIANIMRKIIPKALLAIALLILCYLGCLIFPLFIKGYRNAVAKVWDALVGNNNAAKTKYISHKNEEEDDD